MYLYYTLKTGEKICVFVWDDILKGYDYRRSTNLYPINNGKIDFEKENKIEVKKDNSNKLYFNYLGEKIYFENYNYYQVDELISELIENPDKIKSDDVAATLMKDTNNVGLLSVLPTRDFLIPDMAISIYSGDSPEKILCVLSEKDYEKHLWNYKVTLEARDIELKDIYGTEIIYTRDLTSSLKFGIINLVNINDYQEKKESVKVLK